MKIAFQTFGCKVNFAETSEISRSFRELGFELTNDLSNADVIVLNSCAVTDIAEKKCRSAIRRAGRINPDAFLAVVGCLPQLRGSEIAEMPGVGLVVGNEQKHELPEVISAHFQSDKNIIINSDIRKAKEFKPSYSLYDRTRSFLKIQDGCSYGCAYCTIPGARGRSRSGRIAEIMTSIDGIVRQGVKEIVLTGINIGDFGRPHGENLLMLLRAIQEFNPAIRIRIGSIEPDLLSDEIIEHIAGSELFAPHFHIPLQSGSDKILKAMKRRYQTQLFKERVEKIIDLIPHACIACDIISGFPGETDDDFETSYNLLHSLPLSYFHVFSFSARKNTPAEELIPRVAISKIKERSRLYKELSDQKKREFYNKFTGSQRYVLFESDKHQNMIQGFTDNYIRVQHPWDSSLINKVALTEIFCSGEDDIMNCKLISSMP